MEDPSRQALVAAAAMIGQPARAAMLSALLGGRWLTATELSRCAEISPPTASEHLAGLVAAGLVRRRRSGRHVYHALAGSEAAAALEALQRLSSGHPPRSHNMSSAERDLRFARICYDHLAGRLGVLLAGALVERGVISANGTEVTSAGEAWLRGLDIDVEVLRADRRSHVRFCLDWSERRDHLAGAVGAAITDTMLARGWIVRIEGTRAVRLTLRGREGLKRALELDVEPGKC